MWIIPAVITIASAFWCIVTMWSITNDDDSEEYIKVVAAFICVICSILAPALSWLVWWML